MMKLLAIITVVLLCGLTVITSKDIKNAKNGIVATTNVLKVLSSSQTTEAFKSIAKLASTMAPFLGVMGPAIGIIIMFLPKGESAEMKLMKEEFAKIDAKFDKVFHQFASLKNVIGKSTMMIQYSRHEMHIEHLSDILLHATNKSSEEKEDEFLYYKNKFMNAYQASYDQAAMALFLGMTENGATLENIPSAIRKSSKNDRRDVQNFMKMVMTLIIQGVRLEFAYFGFQNKTTESNILKKNWEKRLEKLTNHMTLVDLSVKNAWFQTLEDDINEKLAENLEKDHAQFADDLYEFLKRKYDWRDWFIVVYDGITGGDKHYVYVCGGKIKFRKHGDKRNLVLSSVLSTTKKPDKRALETLLKLRSKEKNAEKMFKGNLGAEFKKVCSKGAVRKDADPQFRGPEDRVVLYSNKKYQLFAFS